MESDERSNSGSIGLYSLAGIRLGDQSPSVTNWCNGLGVGGALHGCRYVSRRLKYGRLVAAHRSRVEQNAAIDRTDHA